MSEPCSRPCALAVVAGDEPILCLEMVDLLTDEGFEVVDAGNAAQALAAIERLGGIDLLFTDIRTPGPRDGLALAWEVATRWPETRIIVCSALSRPGEDALPAGAHFFDRPFLASAVRKVLRCAATHAE